MIELTTLVNGQELRIVLVHGFNDKSAGENNIDKIVPHLVARGYKAENIDKDTADYDYFNLIAVRFKKHAAVRRVVRALRKAHIVIGYSNGCNFAHKALMQLAGLCSRKLIFIFVAAALNRDFVVPESVAKGYVYFSKTDFWVWVSGLLYRHSWGRAGQKGYAGEDPRIENVDFSDVYRDHGSPWETYESREYFADFIHKHIQESLPLLGSVTQQTLRYTNE